MYKNRKTKSKANVQRMLNTVNGQKIDSFGQHYAIDDVNPLGQNPGSLVYAQNVEWLRTTSGAIPLQTMRGSTLYLNNYTINDPFRGICFFYVSGVEHLIGSIGGWIARYTSSSVTTYGVAPTDKDTIFIPYNDATTPVLFIANEDYGINKLESFVYSNINADPVSCLCYSGTSKRLFKSYQNIVNFSDQQLLSGTAQLETFDAANNFFVGINDAITMTEITDDGKIVWFWMDSGIWGLLNPEDPDPTNWVFPKAVSDVGTISKKTIAYAKYSNRAGYIFLGTDKTLRFFSAELSGNTGTIPILKDYGSITISNSFASILKNIPDDQLSNIVGTYYDSKYLINFTNELDENVCIMLDLEKLDSFGSPYWVYITDQHNTHYFKNKNGELYAANYNGWVSKLFVDNLFTREIPSTYPSVYTDDIVDGLIRKIAIPWEFYIYYSKASETLSKLFDLVVMFKTGGYWGLTLLVSTVIEGDVINDPSEVIDLEVEIAPSYNGNSYYDISLFDVDTFSGISNFNFRNTGAKIEGNYYSFGFKNSNINEWATIYHLQPKYQIMSSSVMPKNF